MQKTFLLASLAALALVALLTCSPGYLLRAGIEEGKILGRRRPIRDVAADPATGEAARRKLELVLQARTFAEKALGLDAGNSYTTYSRVDRDTLMLVLSAARKDRLEGVTWRFPIVGRVPYKGYFNFGAAARAAAKLEARGYDTYLRPTSAFSTLGWFSDPLLSTVLRQDDVALVATVIHELTHNTLYLPSQVAFNESFANFVGDRGAIDFFCGIEGDDGPRCRTARAAWQDNLRFGAFLHELIAELETLYDSRAQLGSTEILRRREEVFERARARFAAEVQPEFRAYDFRSFVTTPLNNATLIARRLYYERLDLFEAAYQRGGSDLPAAIQAMVAAARAQPQQPYHAVHRLAAPTPDTVTRRHGDVGTRGSGDPRVPIPVSPRRGGGWDRGAASPRQDLARLDS